MEEFIKKLYSKALLITGIIICSIGILFGGLFYLALSTQEAIYLDKVTDEFTYSKVDVDLLDDYFATQKLDTKILKYYLAYDNQDKPYVVVLDNVNNSKGIYNKTCKVFLTNDYIISYGAGLNVIETKDLLWIYQFIMKQNSISTNKILYGVNKFRKSTTIATINGMSKKQNNTLDELYQDIINMLSDTLYGYSKENKEKIKELTKKIIYRKKEDKSIFLLHYLVSTFFCQLLFWHSGHFIYLVLLICIAHKTLE